MDPIEGVSQSPSRWPLEFEKKQQEIIELWQACSISLVHRTYFFLLFKGEAADSIYMEVELRRLSFLRDTYSRGSTPSNAIVGSLSTSPVARCVNYSFPFIHFFCAITLKLAPNHHEQLISPVLCCNAAQRSCSGRGRCLPGRCRSGCPRRRGSTRTQNGVSR